MKKWEKLQWYITEKINEVYDCGAKPTKGSGNGPTDKGDVSNPYFMVECKLRNTKDVTIKIDVWEKNKAELPINSTRVPMMALENKNGKRFIVLDPEDFFEILKEAKDGK